MASGVVERPGVPSLVASATAARRFRRRCNPRRRHNSSSCSLARASSGLVDHGERLRQPIPSNDRGLCRGKVRGLTSLSDLDHPPGRLASSSSTLSMRAGAKRDEIESNSVPDLRDYQPRLRLVPLRYFRPAVQSRPAVESQPRIAAARRTAHRTRIVSRRECSTSSVRGPVHVSTSSPAAS